MSALARRWILASLCALAACSSNDATPLSNDDGGTPPAPVEGGSDAGSESDACSGDCALFPPACEAKSLCPVEATFDLRARLNDVKGTSSSDVWAVGSLGTVLHYDGHAWTPSDLGTKHTLTSLAIRPDGEVWATSSVSTIYVHSAGASSDGGVEWHAVAPAHVDPAMWGAVYAVASSPGSAWVWFGADSFEINVLRMKPNDAEIAVDMGLGDVHRAFGRRVLGMHALSKDEIWAVGETGSGFQIKDADSKYPLVRAFNTQTLATLHAVWAVAADDIWAVGSSGTVRRYRGANVWDIVDGIPTTATLRGVWASSSSDVWIVGDNATIVHFDGTAWSRVPVAALGDRRPSLYSVWGADGGHVWASGDGVLLALDGGGSK
ncbi:MAG: hypothetical protein K0S65_4025 [Labilithrix sp.]|nr:hypothetical protein [Labilithrix sp.]